ncbi:heparinase II/III-family protein [Emticicia fluvialis]|uniref:heparinase II/III-family protein n=1 Tax=Emticicia fluvialis TaxID=2974474 RepID=UPI0021661C99|nr:heparinase II/III-family protein [Emticicia fluvialis]
MKNILTIALLICLFTANAQVTQRNILANKYTANAYKQALVPKNQWRPYPRTPDEWKAALPDSLIQGLIKAGEAAEKKEMPQLSASLLMEYVRSGDREKHSKISYARRVNLIDLVLAESVENKGRFTEAIMNYVWAICEETYWGVPAHLGVQKAKSGLPDAEDPTVDLFGAETAAVLALTDYFVGDKLDKISPLLRKRIYSETSKKIFEPIREVSRYGYLSRTNPVNNWNPWIVSNLLVADLLLETDEAKRATNAHTYSVLMDAYLNSLGEDGGCDEGPSYWFAAGACVFDALETLQSDSNGKIDIYNEPLIKNMASYVYKTHIADDYFVNFADADPKLRPDGLMLYRFGKAINDNTLVQFGLWANQRFPSTVSSNNSFHRMRRIANLLTVAKIPATPVTYQPGGDAWFADIQVLTTRSANGLYLATHAGHNAESHNHNDVGDFLIYSDGEPVIIDAGRGNYTARTFSSKRYELWFTQSQYHNLPIVNGKGQLAGKAFEGINVKSSVTDKEASLSMDIAPAYDKTAGIKNWNRIVKLNKAKNVVEITDDYVLTEKPVSIEQVFMTICDIDTGTPGKIVLTTPKGKQLSVNYAAKNWAVSTDLPSTEGMEYNSFKTKWDSRPVRRIILTSKTLSDKGKNVFTVVK